MAEKQIPRGPDNLFCPYWKKKMSACCHTCPKWTQIRGQNPQSHEEVDRWDCADALVPMLLVDLGKRTLGVQAAVETRGNSMLAVMTEGIKRQERQHNEAMSGLKQIEVGEIQPLIEAQN